MHKSVYYSAQISNFRLPSGSFLARWWSLQSNSEQSPLNIIKLVFVGITLISNGALNNRRSLLRRSTYRLWQSALILSFHSLRTTHHWSCHTENIRLLTAISWCSRAADGNTLPNTHRAQMVRYFLARYLPMNACKDKQSRLLHFKHGNPPGCQSV